MPQIERTPPDRCAIRLQWPHLNTISSNQTATVVLRWLLLATAALCWLPRGNWAVASSGNNASPPHICCSAHGHQAQLSLSLAAAASLLPPSDRAWGTGTALGAAVKDVAGHPKVAICTF